MAKGEIKVKEKIQPKYHVVTSKCSTCGTEYKIGTTAKEVKIDVCANCHPFYTGKQTYVAKAGRIEKFNERRTKAVEPKEKVEEVVEEKVEE